MVREPVSKQGEPGWLLLIHQIPPKPNYLRVKIWRRLQGLGAVAVKNSVYVLPRSEQAREDLQWVSREIAEGGGEASICEARFVDGLSDKEVVAMFHAARNADYSEIAGAARRLLKGLGRVAALKGHERHRAAAALVRLKRRNAEVASIDFLDARGRQAVDRMLGEVEARLTAVKRDRRSSSTSSQVPSQGRAWVTRKGIFVDRMASAWLIRRFIDPEARFKFVPSKGYLPRPGETRFDMFDAEYTHRGDRCTFEVLLGEFRLGEPALSAVAEVVHDIDLKDSKYKRPETAGIERLLAGVALTHRDDPARLATGAAVFDALYEGFKRTSS
jgi:hypothetical protein